MEQRKEVEKLKYMHRNPVVRGLVERPDDWRWSSYRSYAYGEAGLVRINDWRWWEQKIRDKAGGGEIRLRIGTGLAHFHNRRFCVSV